jgi:hypothetical protein
MTQDEIIEMARQAVSEKHEKEFGTWFSWKEIEAFAKLVAAKEREACAKVADEFKKQTLMEWPDKIADAIRARDNA